MWDARLATRRRWKTPSFCRRRWATIRRSGRNAYLRPGTRIGSHCRIGDFVETKNAVIGDGTKVSHLTYVGDAELGEDINIGCGVVFVNFDGKEKNKTVVGDGAFIGCNTNLISPVQVGDGRVYRRGDDGNQGCPRGGTRDRGAHGSS